jgi:chaperonin GroEL (HSP60 family)
MPLPPRHFRLHKDTQGAIEDQTVGIRLLARAIEEPPRQIVENASSVAGLSA